MRKLKTLFFVVRSYPGLFGLPPGVEGLTMAAPAVTDAERAARFLAHMKTKQPNVTFALFAISKDNAPGWTALGDQLTDAQLFDGTFDYDEEDPA